MKLAESHSLRAVVVSAEDAVRFAAMVEPEEDGCWEWAGCCDRKGYGQFWLGGRAHWAHRIAYVLGKGDLAVGETVDHLCGNPSCVNPAHLEAVSLEENVRRRAARDRGEMGCVA